MCYELLSILRKHVLNINFFWISSKFVIWSFPLLFVWMLNHDTVPQSHRLKCLFTFPFRVPSTVHLLHECACWRWAQHSLHPHNRQRGLWFENPRFEDWILSWCSSWACLDSWRWAHWFDSFCCRTGTRCAMATSTRVVVAMVTGWRRGVWCCDYHVLTV